LGLLRALQRTRPRPVDVGLQFTPLLVSFSLCRNLRHKTANRRLPGLPHPTRGLLLRVPQLLNESYLAGLEGDLSIVAAFCSRAGHAKPRERVLSPGSGTANTACAKSSRSESRNKLNIGVLRDGARFRNGLALRLQFVDINRNPVENQFAHVLNRRAGDAESRKVRGACAVTRLHFLDNDGVSHRSCVSPD